MTPNTRRFAWVLIALAVLFATAALPSLAQVSQTAKTTQGPSAQEPTQPATGNPANVQPASPVVALQHAVPWRDPNASGQTGFAAPAGAHLSYFGGPIISNVQVIQVLYGSGSYNSQVAGASSPTMGNFFADITGSGSGLSSFLQQYNTTVSGGTNQTFGFGTFGGLFQIVPSAANNGSTISDSQIQSELLSQINAGHLPAPVLDAADNPNTLYMIYFPPGKTITLGSSSSCVAGGFCAYHGTTSNLLSGKHVLYGVFPDMQPGSGCATGCGTSTTFGNYTSMTGHELVEAMTDPDVGIATTFAPPLAWYDPNFEAGTVCPSRPLSYTANGTTYTIQSEFSNSAGSCNGPPPPNPNFSLSASPASLSVNQGSSGSSTITVTPSGGFTGSVTLSASGLPAGVTASFSPNPTTSSSTLTFTASSTATTGTSTITVTGTSGSLTHTTSISLTVAPPAQPDFSLSASPSSLTVNQGSSGSSTITVTSSGGFTGSVSLSASGLPAGVTASFGTNPTTSTSVLTLTASSTATTGTSTITVTGTSGSLTHTTSISLTVIKPDFSLSASPSSLTVNQGSSGSSTITVTSSGGFTGSVSLSASGLPAGVTASFGTNPTTSTSALTLTASSTATTGTATITVTGTSGSLTHTTTITLTVTTGDFSLSALPSSLSLLPGVEGSSTITVNPVNGFTGPVSLSTSALPSGVFATFDTNPTTSTSNVTFISITSASGTVHVTITGTSGALTHTTSVTLTLQGGTIP